MDVATLNATLQACGLDREFAAGSDLARLLSKGSPAANALARRVMRCVFRAPIAPALSARAANDASPALAEDDDALLPTALHHWAEASRDALRWADAVQRTCAEVLFAVQTAVYHVAPTQVRAFCNYVEYAPPPAAIGVGFLSSAPDGELAALPTAEARRATIALAAPLWPAVALPARAHLVLAHVPEGPPLAVPAGRPVDLLISLDFAEGARLRAPTAAFSLSLSSLGASLEQYVPVAYEPTLMDTLHTAQLRVVVLPRVFATGPTGQPHLVWQTLVLLDWLDPAPLSDAPPPPLPQDTASPYPVALGQLGASGPPCFLAR